MPTLYVTGVSAGNAADLTEDIIQSYTLPGGTLFYVGDIVHVVAGGVFGATTDVKTARIRFGGVTGTVLASPSGNTAGQIRWCAEAWVVKTGTGTQSFTSMGDTVNATTDGTSAGTTALDDTAAIQIVVTGQNGASATAGAVGAQYFHVRLVR